MKTLHRLGALWLLCMVGPTQAQEPAKAPEQRSFLSVPETVSKEWQEALAARRDPNTGSAFPAPDNVEAWKHIHQLIEAHLEPKVEAAVQRYEPTIARRTLGGVDVLDIKPKGWHDDGKLLVFMHGGAYTVGSARSSLGTSLLVAHETGLRVVSVDYTVAPLAQFDQVTDEVVAVLQALAKQGYSPQDIALFGASSGGALAAGSVLKMRDQGLPMPAAVALWSPWADITQTGDTYSTLKRAEANYVYEKHLKPSADAYADPEDQKHPYVSPVYGDFTKGYPPTLIQGGTKEIFLSNFVRLYQALDTAGQWVKLDLYEGMPHIFQAQLPDSPESKQALGKMKRFLSEHLKSPGLDPVGETGPVQDPQPDGSSQ
ncbi:MAG: alpha/beta hydrolase [Acidobacteriota bacterium]